MVDLANLDASELLTDYKKIDDVLATLAEIPEGLVTEDVLQGIKDAHQQLMDVLKSRGYSEDEITEMSRSR